MISVTVPIHVEKTKLDEYDLAILGLLKLNRKSKEIAAGLGKPLSTVQRRIRILFDRGIVSNIIAVDYDKLGMKKGQLHVSLQDGKMMRTAEKIAEIEGILEVSVYIGNSDIVGTFVHTNSAELLDLLTQVRGMDGVDKAVWAEEVHRFPGKWASQVIY